VISVSHLPELPRDLESLLEQGILKREAYDSIKAQYGLNFMYEPPVDFPAARSVIITAMPQPKVRVTFTKAGEKIDAFIPPTYIHDTDKVVFRTISEQLSSNGYKAIDAVLPGKRIAVHSGLAVYGKNNIVYIEGLGSYFRLRAYFSDMDCISDCWNELKMMALCENCSACLQRCPTKAISEDRFVIDANRCLTFLNEGEADFPDWVDPAWHNCLIGCMHCQDICPANRDHKLWIVDGGDFTEEETTMILKGVSAEKLPPETAEKMEKLYMLGAEKILQRNLDVLIRSHEDGG
jgi:epoxyqueuosine reductase